MARIEPLPYEDAQPSARQEWDRQVAAHGRMTNMKRTLARSPLSLRIYMDWYPLRDEVEAFLGRRLTLLFAHAISAETDCLICSTYFRRFIIDSGEDPDQLKLTEMETSILEFGRQVARDSRAVPDSLFASVQRYLGPDELVALVAFAGQMVATNVINNVLDVDLDDYLETYRASES